MNFFDNFSKDFVRASKYSYYQRHRLFACVILNRTGLERIIERNL